MLGQMFLVAHMLHAITMSPRDFSEDHQIEKEHSENRYLIVARGGVKENMLFSATIAMKNYFIIPYCSQKTLKDFLRLSKQEA